MGRIHSVKGGRGLKLHVREWGNPDGAPILLVHGWSQNHLAWHEQYRSPLLQDFRVVAPDLRGHGMSDAPVGDENYNDPLLWADDVASIIDQLGLVRPVLAGSSYGGFVISDYVRVYGQGAIAGVNYVGAAVILGKAAFGPLIGPGFVNNVPGATESDLPTNIIAMRNFLRDCVKKNLSPENFETLLAFNMAVPARVRAGLARREVNSDDVLAEMNVPVLVTQGKDDIVVLPAMAEHILKVCPTAKVSWYDGVGHIPFMEEPERFNRELCEFRRGNH